MITLIDLQRAAVRRFAERGYAATSIRDVAAEAGVTSGALYLHVASKLELLESVMLLALDELIRLAKLAAAFDRPPAQQLEGLVRAHVAVQAINPLTARVVDGELWILPEESRQVVVARRDAYERFWTDAIRAGVRRGEFAVEDSTLARLALVEMCNGVAHWYRSGRRTSLDRVQDVFVDMAFGLLRYHGPRAGPEAALAAHRLPCEPLD